LRCRRRLGGGANQDDVAGLHARQKGILLGLVEPVNLVDEEDRAPAEPTARVFGFGHYLADFLDSREHGAEGDEPRPRHACDQSRQGGLAGTWRTPQDDRVEAILFDRLTQRPAGREQRLLPDVLVERTRTHPLGERRRGRDGGRFRLIEQRHYG
jgi:hypothetical protein